MSVSQARVSLPRAKLWRRELEELRRVPKRVGPVRTWHTEIAGQKALKARLRVRARSVARRRVALSVTQWSVVADGYEYVLSFTTAKAHESAYAATFERSAKSLELVEPRPEPEPAPAANDFAEQAHPICLADVWFPEAGTNVTPTQRARQAAKRVAEKLRELKRLSPPAGSRREYRAMLAAGERLLAAMRRHADATAAGDGSAAGRAVNEAHRVEREGARHARKLGLGGCG